jgi:hypothetical protein
MRASIARQSLFELHVYSQYPETHAWGGVDLHWLVWVQFGLGSVFTWHAPWLQYSPVGHGLRAEQDALHWPPVQMGVAPEHWELVVHDVPPGLGSHAPLVQV